MKNTGVLKDMRIKYRVYSNCNLNVIDCNSKEPPDVNVRMAFRRTDGLPCRIKPFVVYAGVGVFRQAVIGDTKDPTI